MTRRFLAVLAISVAIIPPGNLLSQEQSLTDAPVPAIVTAKVSRSSIQVAEPFQFELQCLAPSGSQVHFPAVMETLGEFEVIDYHDTFDVPAPSSRGQRIWTRRVTLESILTGERFVPAIELQVSSPSGNERVESDALPVTVISLLEDRPDPTRFRDVKPLIDVEVAERRSGNGRWWFGGGLAAVSFLLAAVILATRRRRLLSPVQWAQLELDQLAEAVGTGTTPVPDCNLVARKLSSILRGFLELQFEISMPGQTSDELVHRIRNNDGVNAGSAQQIRTLFLMTRQATYARRQLSARDLQKAIQETREVIDYVSLQNQGANDRQDDSDITSTQATT